MNSLLGQFESYLINRRRQLQDWEASPPVSLGWAVFVLVSLEWTMARALFDSDAFSLFLAGKFLGQAILIGAGAFLFSKIAMEFSSLFGKSVKTQSLVPILLIGLAPLLLYLPLAALIWTIGANPIFLDLILIVLLLRVLSNWRESTEICYEFSRWQSALAASAGVGLAVFIAFLAVYVKMISALLNAASLLS